MVLRLNDGENCVLANPSSHRS